jgi:hypothetical protein
MVGLFVGCVLLVCGAGCSGRSAPIARPRDTVTRPAPVSTSRSVATTRVEGDIRYVTVAVVTCPTTHPGGVSRASAGPSNAQVRVPRDLTTKLALYRDKLGLERAVGPAGWKCNASDAEDGSGTLNVFPQGEHLGSNILFRRPTADSRTRVVSVYQSGLSEVQGAGWACGYFADATRATVSDLGHGCARPSAREHVQHVNRTLVRFEDPVGVAGVGTLSGGRLRSVGVMTYRPSATPTTYETSCTLARSNAKVCRAVLLGIPR